MFPRHSYHYHFVTHWRVDATAEEVYTILENPTDLVQWWPSVYLRVEEVKSVSEMPSVYRLHTKGWLPYTLNWQFVTTRKIPHKVIALQASGDFRGTGVWTLIHEGNRTYITFDWKIQADKPLLRYGSFILKPLFAANHRWAMTQGERSLKLEIEKRRSGNAHTVPPPPPISGITSLLLSVGVTVLLLKWGIPLLKQLVYHMINVQDRIH